MSPGIGCPDSFSEQRVKALQCSSQNLYHCLYNELDEIVEICTESIWIPAGNCPVYNNGASKLNYVPCQTSRGECPSDVFFSNEILKYSGCIPLSRSPEATLTWEINTPYLNSTTDNTFENTTSTSPLLFLLIPLVFLALILIILLAIIRRRKGICTREENHKHEDEEIVIPLVTRNTSDNQVSAKYPSFPKLYTMVDELKSKRAVIIIGTWGSGKSTLAKQIKENVQQDPKFANAESIELSHLNNWQMVVPKDMISIVQLKDCVKNWYSEDYASIIRREFEDLINKRSHCYFIILIRCSEWNRLNIEDEEIPYFHAHSVFEDNREKLIEWHTEKNIFVIKDKKQMPPEVIKLKQSFSEYSFSRNLGIGFPGVVNLVCRNKRLQSAARFAVKEPVKALQDDLKRLRDSELLYELCHFIILVYTMLCGGKFNLNSINADLLDKLRKLYKCEGNDPMKIFCENLCEEYLNVETGQPVYFSLVHDIVARVLFRVVSSSNIDLLIEECDSDLLLDCIVVYGYQEFKKQQRENFAKRLRQIELEEERPDIKHHVFLKEKDFARVFERASEINAEK